MKSMFDGKEIRDEILRDLAGKIAKMKRQPTMAEFLIGADPVSRKYVELKKKMAEKIGIQFSLYEFGEDASEEEILVCISYLNNDPETDGIFIQIPLPKKFDRNKLIGAISPKKDIDGLRFCLEIESGFKPPVVMAIMEAINRSKADTKNSKIAIVGQGFLVGAPLARTLQEQGIDFDSFDSHNSTTCLVGRRVQQYNNYNILISATGKPNIIKPEMVKDGAILIDAGTAEENGQLVGDIDQECYKKASYYTPVPGGIGPVTVAMLFRNLINMDDGSNG